MPLFTFCSLPAKKPDFRLEPDSGMRIDPVLYLPDQLRDLRRRGISPVDNKTAVLFRHLRVSDPKAP